MLAMLIAMLFHALLMQWLGDDVCGHHTLSQPPAAAHASTANPTPSARCQAFRLARAYVPSSRCTVHPSALYEGKGFSAPNYEQDAKAAEEVHAANRKALQDAGFMPYLLALGLELRHAPSQVRCHVRHLCCCGKRD